MTDKLKPTLEQIQRACDMLNSHDALSLWALGDYGKPNYFAVTALADTIAELDAEKQISADTLARAEKAEADLGEIGGDLACYVDDPHAHEAVIRSARRAAPYRVETDPLIEMVQSALDTAYDATSKLTDKKAHRRVFAEHVAAELAKRGVTVGEQTDADQ